jgi:hypothetical protein
LKHLAGQKLKQKPLISGECCMYVGAHIIGLKMSVTFVLCNEAASN